MEPESSKQRQSDSIMRYVSVDFVIVAAAIVVGALFVIVDGGNPNPAWIPFTLPLVFFLPGYSLLAALYPRPSSLGAVPRIALSIALSVAVVPMLSLLLGWSPFQLGWQSLLATVVLVSFVLLILAVYRRLVDRERESDPADPPTESGDASWSMADPSTVVTLLLFFIVIVFPVIGSAFVERTEHYTEFYLLEPGGTTNGTAANMSGSLPGPVTLGIVNHEGRTVDYTVLIQLNGTASGTPPVSGNGSIERIERVTVQDGVQHTFTYTPSASAIRADRIEFLLLKEIDSGSVNLTSPPMAPESAYRYLYLWISPPQTTEPIPSP